MLDPRLHEKMEKGWIKIGDIGYSIALNLKKGKDHISRQRDLWDQGIKIHQLLKILYRHVDTNTTPPTLIRITEAQVNRILLCLQEIGNLDALPIVPSLSRYCKPIAINRGLDGANGANGIDGTNALITVEPEDGETDISVREEIVGSVKKYYLTVDLYEAPTVTLEITAPKVYMIGEIVPVKGISITTIKGRDDITSMVMTAPVDLDDELQAVLNLSTVNGEVQPVINSIVDTDVSESKTYTVMVSDGESGVEASDEINFYYPYLFGSSPGTGIDLWDTLSRKVEPKETKGFAFNDTNAYFWIAFPASYGPVIIKDQNGFVVTDEFTLSVADVTSTGLDVDWTVSYNIYRTTDITDIEDATFTIEFTT
jgi:hypothetical protein